MPTFTHSIPRQDASQRAGELTRLVQSGPVRDSLNGFLSAYLVASGQVEPEPVGVTATLAHLTKRNAPSVTVREDYRTGQYFGQLDGCDVSPSSFDEERALQIAQQQAITRCAEECGMPSQSGDIYCQGCRSGRERARERGEA